MRFWDSSAIVPLVIGQPATREAERWLAADGELVIWTLTPVEVVSALRRLVRDATMTEEQAFAAEEMLARLVPRLHVITDVEGGKREATRLLRVHPLRAADALQLGAALLWAGRAPRGAVLHTLDRRLATAARREGFTVG